MYRLTGKLVSPGTEAPGHEPRQRADFKSGQPGSHEATVGSAAVQFKRGGQ
jgi:hypothetical protein